MSDITIPGFERLPLAHEAGEDAEMALLEGIRAAERDVREEITQRRLADEAGLSLGMTNALLKRCVEKGWVLIRRVNARNLRYALTPEGTNEVARRTYRYFRRTARSVSLYRDLVETFVMERKRAGIARILLAGPSDLDFLLEFACQRHGLTFAKSGDVERARRAAASGDACLILGEGVAPDAAAGNEGEFGLKDLLLGRESWSSHEPIEKERS